MPEHFLVLGATGKQHTNLQQFLVAFACSFRSRHLAGPSGIEFCKLALNEGHQITIYARSPSKLPNDVSSHANAIVFQGTFDDQAGLESAAKCGAKRFISFAGPTANMKGTPVADCFKILFPLLIENGFSRALVLGTPSFVVEGKDKSSFKWKISIALIKVIGGTAYQEILGMGKLTTELPSDKIEWTFFRVPWLGSGEAKKVKAAYAGSGEDGLFLSRKGMVKWVLDEVAEKKWVGGCPILSE
jgi:hypothetical protein